MSLEICKHGIIKKVCAACHEAEQELAAPFTRKDVIEALRELYAEWCDLKAMADGCASVRLPDYEAMLDELEKTGMPVQENNP